MPAMDNLLPLLMLMMGGTRNPNTPVSSMASGNVSGENDSAEPIHTPDASAAAHAQIPHIKNMMKDIIPYVPGNTGSISRMVKMMDVMEMVRDINQPEPLSTASLEQSESPAGINKSLGLLNVIGRHMPNSGLSQGLGQMQGMMNMMQMVNNMGGLGSMMNNMGNIGNLMGGLGQNFAAQSVTPQSAPTYPSNPVGEAATILPNPVLDEASKSATPQMLEQILSGMTPAQRSELLAAAENIFKG